MSVEKMRIARSGPGRAKLAVALAAGLLSCLLFAAPLPNAGNLLPSVPSAPPAASGKAPLVVAPAEKPATVPANEARIKVSHIRITGNTAFSEAQLQELIAADLTPEDASPTAGRRLTFAELQGLAERVTAYYREHGYLLARAYLPAQSVEQGQLEMAVLEGRISRVNVSNGSRHADATLNGRFDDVARETPLANATLERSLLLLGDLPGSDVQATVRPGVSVGTSELDIAISDRKGLYSGDVSVDNEGNRFSGEYRLGAALNLNSPLRLGDSLNLNLLGGGQGYHYGRLAWQVPLGQRGLAVGLAASSMDYRLEKEFAPLQAHGTAQIGSVYAL